jgi:hypothetical protein
MSQYQGQFKFDEEYEDEFTVDSDGHIDMIPRNQRNAHTHMSTLAPTMPQSGDEFNFPPGAFDFLPTEEEKGMLQRQSDGFNSISVPGPTMPEGHHYDDPLSFTGDGTYFSQQKQQQQRYPAFPQQNGMRYAGDPQYPQTQDQFPTNQQQPLKGYARGHYGPYGAQQNQLPPTQQQVPIGYTGYPDASQYLYHHDGKPVFADREGRPFFADPQPAQPDFPAYQSPYLPQLPYAQHHAGYNVYGHQNNIYGTFSQQQHVYVAPQRPRQPGGYISHTDHRRPEDLPSAYTPSVASKPTPPAHTKKNPGSPQGSDHPVPPKEAFASPSPAMKTFGSPPVPQRAKVNQVELKVPGTWAGGKFASKGPSEPQPRKLRKLAPAGPLPGKVTSHPRSPERAPQVRTHENTSTRISHKS